MSSHIEQISKKYGWPLAIHCRGHDAYLVGFQPLADGPVPIYRWPGGDSIADSRELDCDVEMFHHLEDLLKKKPAALYEQGEIFKAYPLWYKDLALYAMECVSSRQGADQFAYGEDEVRCPWCGKRVHHEIGVGDGILFHGGIETCPHCGRQYDVTANQHWTYDTVRVDQ